MKKLRTKINDFFIGLLIKGVSSEKRYKVIEQYYQQKLLMIKQDAETPRKALNEMWSFIQAKGLENEFNAFINK